VTRGAIYTAAARGAYTGKPRPVVILQNDLFDATASITVCPFHHESCRGSTPQAPDRTV